MNGVSGGKKQSRQHAIATYQGTGLHTRPPSLPTSPSAGSGSGKVGRARWVR